MKKLLFATILLLTLTTAGFAAGNNTLFDNLRKAIKTTSNIVWKNTEEFKEAIFQFNGKTAVAQYDVDNDELIGFSIYVGVDELPAGTVQDVQKKFKGWAIADKLLFIPADGNAGGYYIEVTDGKSRFALSVRPNGKVKVYSRMP